MITVLALLVPAVVAMSLALVATSSSVGLSADSVCYISAARELAAGHGLVIPWGSVQPIPLNLWPPLFPAVLAGLNLVGLDPVCSARWLNSFAFGATVLLIGVFIRSGTGSLWLAVCCASLLTTSGNMLGTHAMAWSEPLFLLCGFSGLFLLARDTSKNKNLRWVAAAGLLGLAALTRYAGVSLVLAGTASLLFGSGRFRDRARKAASLAILAAIPLAGWMIWNVTQGRSSTTRVLGWHPHFSQIFSHASGVIGQLLLPARLLSRTTGVLVTLLASGCVVALTIHARRSSDFDATTPRMTMRAKSCWLLGLVIACYATFYLAAGTLFDPAIDFRDVRHMLPVLLACFLLAVLGGYTMWEAAGRRRSVAAMVFVGCCGLLFVLSPRIVNKSLQLSRNSGSGGEGFHDKKWRASPTIAAVHDLPRNVKLYSNAPDAIYILTHRNSVRMPRKDAWKQASQNDLKASFERIRRDIENGALIVFLKRLAWRGESPDAEDLKQCLPLRAVVDTPDGTIYALADIPD